MRRAPNVLKYISLIFLTTFEVCLLTVFLPLEWQIVISGWIGRVLPDSYDYSRVTHPALGTKWIRSSAKRRR